MGRADGKPDEQPLHQVSLSGFWLDRTPVCNAQFRKFVEATHYVTVAERHPDPKDFPDAPPASLAAGALVFTPPTNALVSLDDPGRWWSFVAGADWRHPRGPGSNLQGLERHPVTQVCWDDAQAYARWAGKRLPTEAEFEYAARGGLDRAPFVWGGERQPGGQWMANIWQGEFPRQDLARDGFAGTSPVASFPANGYHLFDMSGNVWEWCADWYRPDYYAHSPAHNPPGPPDSFDPDEPRLPKRVLRGGSFLCDDSYCGGYRPATRMKCSPDTGLSNTGFRCAK
jgi:formylglycine-generating enzyme required for sulfatase activity